MHIFLTNAMLMYKSTYAKVRTIHAILKINMDNYRYYLTMRVWIFMSSEQDFIPVLFIPLGASSDLDDGDYDGCTSF